MIGYRPCGACVAYVPAASGCGHWHPGQGTPGERKGKGAASRERKRERDRVNAAAARARAKADVAAFREMMERQA
jgi:hypothetical protein